MLQSGIERYRMVYPRCSWQLTPTCRHVLLVSPV